MLLIFCLHPHIKTAHFKQQLFLPTAGSEAGEHLCIHTSCLLYAIWARWLQSAEKAEIRPCIQAKQSSYSLKNMPSSHVCTAQRCWINETFRPGRSLLRCGAICSQTQFPSGDSLTLQLAVDDIRSWEVVAATAEAFILANRSLIIQHCFLGWEWKQKPFWQAGWIIYPVTFWFESIY